MNPYHGIRIAEHSSVNRVGRRLGFVALALVTLATVAIAFVSFARKVDSFTTAGFSYQREGGELVLVAVEPGGAAALAGLAPADRIVLADGQTAASLPHPEKWLAP